MYKFSVMLWMTDNLRDERGLCHTHIQTHTHTHTTKDEGLSSALHRPFIQQRERERERDTHTERQSERKRQTEREKKRERVEKRERQRRDLRRVIER